MPFSSCSLLQLLPKEALIHHLFCLGLCWHRTRPEIGQLQGAHSPAATERGVDPSSVVPWSLLAPDSTRNRTTSRCPSPAATERGVDPSSVVPWSLLAPDSTRNRTTSRCPSAAAMRRGVDASSVVPWSLLAPDSTRNRTTSRCPFSSCYRKRR